MSDLEYEEVCRQPYKDCAFSSGFVYNHSFDTIYLRLARDGEESTTILLRPDEAAALAWCLTGVIWSERMRADGYVPAEDQPAPSVFVCESRAPETPLAEGARRYIRDVPEIATVIHKGLPMHARAAQPAEGA